MNWKTIICLLATTAACIGQAVPRTTPWSRTFLLSTDATQATNLLGLGILEAVLEDGDKGDIIVSGSGTIWTIEAIYQTTNAALTALSSNPSMYQATNATLTLLSTNTVTGTGRIVLESAAGSGDGTGDALLDGTNVWTGPNTFTNTFTATTVDVTESAQIESITSPAVSVGTLTADTMDGVPLINTPSIEMTEVGTYSVAWNDNPEVPTKGAVYAKIETISTGGGTLGYDIDVIGVSTNDTVFTLTSIPIIQDTTFVMDVDVIGAAPTNSMANTVVVSGSRIGTNVPIIYNTISARNVNENIPKYFTNTWGRVTNNTLELVVKGHADEHVNWLAQGFFKSRVHAGVSVVVPPDPEEVDLTNGLVAYWTLNEVSGTRNDSTDNDYNLSQVGTVSSQTGMLEGAAGFPGNANNYLTKTHEDAFSSTNFTIAGWVYLNHTNSSQYIVTKSTTTDEQREWVVWWSTVSKRLLITFYTDLTAVSSINVGSYDLMPVPDTWYFFAAVVDGSTMEVRTKIGTETVLDEWARVTGADWTTESRLTTVPVMFGRLGGSTTTAFNGRADEWGFWNRALNDDEVETLWNSGAGLTHPFTVE